MADLVPYRRVHVIGVGGAGMSGLAKILAQSGHSVSGSDLKPGPALSVLAGAGVTAWVGHRPERASDWDLVVASSAVPLRDPEIRAAVERGIEVWERPRLLKEITRKLPTIGVTGTHGKTTGTAMMVTALRSLGRDPSFMVGGELVDLNTNAHLGEEDLFVLEADEAFGTFLSLDLQGLLLTNVDEDHLDHYGTIEELTEAFVTVASGVSGPVVACLDDPGAAAVAEAVGGEVVGYGASSEAKWKVDDLVPAPDSVSFTLIGPDGEIPVRVPKPGEQVAANAAGVLALIGELGLDVQAAAEGLASFAGVHRRFEVRARIGGVTVVDDYAHHPTELAATIGAAAGAHPGRIVAVFQPHRFTRTAAQSGALGRALGRASRVFVTDVYAAGEAPIPGVTGRVVADAAAGAGAEVTYVARRTDLARAVAREVVEGDLVLLLGAGDVTLVADELAPLLAAQR